MRNTSRRLENKILTGKTAIITGGAYGIGRAITEELLVEGAKVIIFDNNKLKLKQTLRELNQYENIFGYEVDIRDKEKIKKTLIDIEKKIGRVNTLVNNAGVNPHSSLFDMPDKMWQDTLDINLTGSKNMTQIVGMRMKEQNIKGSIIFITSIHTLLAFAGDAHYDASKHGMLGLMRVTALEWAEYGIRSNAVAPGAIYPTGITEGMTKNDLNFLSTRIPLKRHGNPKEIAQVVVFLASDKTSYITGAEVRVDGGLAIKSVLT